MFCHFIEHLYRIHSYFFDILTCFRTHFKEWNASKRFEERFSFLFSYFPGILEIKFRSNHKEQSLLMNIISNFPNPDIKFFKTVLFLDRIQKQHSSDSFVCTFDNTFEGLLTHLYSVIDTVSQICSWILFFSLIWTYLVLHSIPVVTW